MIDYIKFALSSVKHRQRRSLLTMLGILIGISAVVGLIAISEGMEKAIESQLELMGADVISILPGKIGEGKPGFIGAKRFSESDIEAVKTVRGVETVAPMIMKTAKIEYKKQTRYTYVFGTKAKEMKEIFFKGKGLKVIAGKDIEHVEKDEIVVGPLIVDNFFDKSPSLRDKLTIEGEKFKIASVLSEIGNPQDDSQIYMNLDSAKELFNETEISIILIKVEHRYDVDKVAKKIKNVLKEERNADDFSVMTAKQLSERISVILGIVQAVLIGIAAISLLVGGVGIMNTMYVSVYERTKEIGIMKAVGAKNRDILTMFLIESGLLGLSGGAIGCIIGSLLALLIEYGAAQYGWSMLKAHVTLELLFFSLCFSFIIGMVSGVLPARRAARMNPVDALRYE